MCITAKDLLFKDYTWGLNQHFEKPKRIGKDDKALLNRKDGNEMVYFLESLINTWEWKMPCIRAAQHVETVIKTEVPAEIHTYGGVETWLRKSFLCFG